VSDVPRHRRVFQQNSALVRSTRPPGTFVPGNRVVVDRLQLMNRAKARSSELLASVARLDATVDAAARAQIVEWVRQEYDSRQGGMLIGLFAKCYLGPPYVDHKLSLTQAILQHYAPGEDPGFPYSNARGLVRSAAYAYIEIYSDGAIVPVRTDGSSVDLTPAT
jgi:hypothetical protein